MRPRIAPLAGAGLLALATLNGWSLFSLVGEILEGDRPAGEGLTWRPQLSTSADDIGGQKRIDDYPMTLARPAFFKSREPFVPPPPPPPPPPPKVAQQAPSAPIDPGLILGGVMTLGHVRKAYLLTKTNPEGSWVAEGDSYMGWIIKSVESSSAKVQQQDRTVELELYPQGQTDSSLPTAESPKGVTAPVRPPALGPAPPTRPPFVFPAK